MRNWEKPGKRYLVRQFDSQFERHPRHLDNDKVGNKETMETRVSVDEPTMP